MGEFENTIVELYDNCPGRHQIKAIAGMFNISLEEVEKILTAAGREIPSKPGRPKLSTKAADPQNDKVDEISHEAKDIPEAVRECILARIAELETKKTVIEAELKTVETELKTLIDFIA